LIKKKSYNIIKFSDKEENHMISFNPLWKTLIDRGINRSELTKAGISSATLAKMKKNGNVNIDTVDRVCEYLDCDISSVIEFIKITNSEGCIAKSDVVPGYEE
jgi:DNA-binding Xre family transcriptional regulator